VQAKDLTQAEYDSILNQLTIPAGIRQYRQHFRIPSFGVAVPDDPVVPPELHAHLIWRAQFVQVSSIYSQLYSRLEFSRNVIPCLLNTARSGLDFYPSRELWEGILKAAWVAALKIAIEWNQMLAHFRQYDFSQAEHQWLTSVDRWAGRLGCWKHRRYFPIGLIKVRDAATGDHQLYFVVA